MSSSSSCFNPRSPCGERPSRRCGKAYKQLFQSTFPVRGATSDSPTSCTVLRIVSIHAPRAGSDTQRLGSCRWGWGFNPRFPCGERRTRERMRRNESSCFNPRSPCGERPHYGAQRELSKCFNPRSPCGERHHKLDALMLNVAVSIHAPRAGSDVWR